MHLPRIRGLVAISATALLIGLLAVLFAPDPIAVDTAVAKRGPMLVTVSSEGRTRVKEQYEVVAPIAGRLLRVGLKAGDAVVRLDILRSADRVPICSTTSWLPAARAADAARVFRASRSITATLAHFGIKDYRRQSTRITAAAADALDAERLHLVPGRPILVVDSINVTMTGRPIPSPFSRVRSAEASTPGVVRSISRHPLRNFGAASRRAWAVS